MDCFLETIASVWMLSVRPPPVEVEEVGIHDNLEGCRNNLESREADLTEGCRRMGQEALKRKQAGDVPGARAKMMERKRALKRLEKLRSSLVLVDAQLDALRTTELDKELMQTLIASSAALKRAGVGKGVKEAEAVMSELDEQMRESGELTSVLAGGLQDVDSGFDLDMEFDLMEHENELLTGMGTAIKESVVSPPAVDNLIDETPSMQHMPVATSALLMH